MFINGLLLIYQTDHSNVSRILDICQELKVLSSVLECNKFHFAIDLAALASRREYLNLEKWLKDRLQSQGSEFFIACLEFLKDRAGPGVNDLPISFDVVRTFLQILHKASP